MEAEDQLIAFLQAEVESLQSRQDTQTSLKEQLAFLRQRYDLLLLDKNN
jgi:hypothetical protein